MNVEKMREQFEKIAGEHYLLCELSLQRDEHQLDEYLDPEVQIAWEFFVLSREAVVVELTDEVTHVTNKDFEAGRDAVIAAIEAQGLKVKP